MFRTQQPLLGADLENFLCVDVIHFHVDLSQEVLQLLQGHLIVFIFVCFPHAVDDPADSWM